MGSNGGHLVSHGVETVFAVTSVHSNLDDFSCLNKDPDLSYQDDEESPSFLEN